MESYHTQHAPFGAFASFTVGLVGAPGGFGQSLTEPADQNVYVGFRERGERWKLLPFFIPPDSQETNFTGEASGPDLWEVDALSTGDYRRDLALASDTWRAGKFVFELLTPFGAVPDPATLDAESARKWLAPVVFGRVGYDNRGGDSAVELVFGLSNPAQQLRPLSDAEPGLLGFAQGNAFGFATTPTDAVRAVQQFSLFGRQQEDPRGLFLLGYESGLRFTVPAGELASFPLVLGFYQSGIVTTGLHASYLYTRYFTGLEDALLHGLSWHRDAAVTAGCRDRELAASALSEPQRFLLAQAAHSYYASTELLNWEGRPLWIVNEGEYRMMNTFDLTADQIFFELHWHPWAVRNVLDLFAERYCYRDTLRAADGRTAAGGLSFTHDMGVMNQFTPPGLSSYECVDLTGCFSHMTMEQLVNWVLCAVTYARHTGDHRWLAEKEPTLRECAESLRRRDDPDPGQRDGVLKWDSRRCGARGAEITTYDSLDISLGQARLNLYLSMKALAAWQLLGAAFDELSDTAAANEARANGDRAARGISNRFDSESGCFPAVFESRNRSRILPAVEGLAFPLFLKLPELINPSPALAILLAQLGRHLAESLRPGVCLDSTTGGWKLSSTSPNTWFSKIALAQHVIRSLFPAALSTAAAAGDRVHAQWQRTPGCGRWAMCDQINSDTGRARGSRYYPRGVTAWLWLGETANPVRD